MNSILRRLREARKSLGLTQTAMAKSIGLTPQAYSQSERGQSTLPDVRLFQICTIHGISSKWIETGAGDMFQRKSSQGALTKEALIDVGIEMFKALPFMYKDILLSIARRIVSDANVRNESPSNDKIEIEQESTTDSVK